MINLSSILFKQNESSVIASWAWGEGKPCQKFSLTTPGIDLTPVYTLPLPPTLSFSSLAITPSGRPSRLLVSVDDYGNILFPNGC